MALRHYACTNCGSWTLWFEHERPHSCSVCLDPRNALPKDGFVFLTEEEAQRGRTTSLERLDERLSVARETPALGLGSAGWIIDTGSGSVAIEGAGHYSESALAEIGSLDVIASTHPHGYGAIWQLQEATEAPIAVHRADIPHTKAFKVTRPLDDEGELHPSIRYARLGGHYDGQCAFFDEEAQRVFLGDAVKIDYKEDGDVRALSAHKGFHYGIPLTPQEIEGYERALRAFPFVSVATTFDHARELNRDTVLAFLARLKASKPTTLPIDLESL